MRHTIPALFACLALILASLATAAESKWEQVHSFTGKITSTTVQTGGGNNNNNRNRNNNGKNSNVDNYRVKPEYKPFNLDGAAMRIKYETKANGDRPDLKIELEKEVTKPNGDKDWQRVGVVGRSRGDGQGGAAFSSGPGQYRLELTGQRMQYTITIEQPIKK